MAMSFFGELGKAISNFQEGKTGIIKIIEEIRTVILPV